MGKIWALVSILLRYSFRLSQFSSDKEGLRQWLISALEASREGLNVFFVETTLDDEITGLLLRGVEDDATYDVIYRIMSRLWGVDAPPPMVFGANGRKTVNPWWIMVLVEVAKAILDLLLDHRREET